jgi:hypothetical protein
LQQGDYRREPVGIQYKHLEGALAEVLDIKADKMPAFRARLRHLRNIGLPKLPTPGSGQQIQYTRRQGLEMLIALELEGVGQAPKSAAALALSIVRQSPYGQHEGKDYFVAIAPSQKGYTISASPEAMSELMAKAEPVLSLVNVSACVRKLDDALSRRIALG